MFPEKASFLDYFRAKPDPKVRAIATAMTDSVQLLLQRCVASSALTLL